MGKKKIRKFQELNRLPNTFQNFTFKAPKLIDHTGKVVDYKGSWSKSCFGNDKPLVLELACGKGEYTLALGKMFPGSNFIGVDIKGNRMWKGAKKAYEEGLKNVVFVRTRIEQLHEFFGEGEVSEIWITFPDPFLKERKRNKRLTSGRFLNIYRKISAPDCIIHLKTDDNKLFEFTLKTIEQEKLLLIDMVRDVYRERPEDELLTLKTFYEKLHLEEGKKIKYLSFRL